MSLPPTTATWPKIELWQLLLRDSILRLEKSWKSTAGNTRLCRTARAA